MPDTLHKTIAGVRKRARWTLVFRGVGWGVVLGAGVLLITGILDYYLRMDDRVSRMTFSVLCLLAIIAVVFRFFLPPLRRQLTELSVAQRIQDRFPSLQNKVASAVEFSQKQEDDQLAGSAAMRQAVIQEVTGELAEVPLGEVVRYRPAVTASLAALGTLGVILLIAFSIPTGSGIALARLTNPFGDTVWPQINQLFFRNPPTHIPVGGLFEVEVDDKKGALPEDVFIEYQFEDEQGIRSFRNPMHFVDGIMVVQRKNVKQSFSYRAVGGDDETPWQSLIVVTPPRVEALQVSVRPPDYAGWPTTASTGPIVGLEGSTVQLTGNTNKTVESATLKTETGDSKPLAIDGLQIRFPSESTDPWVLRKSGTYSITMVDEHGIEGGGNEQWQVDAISDEPPTVSVESPIPQSQASSDAMLPVRVFGKDGLAIRDILLRYTRSDQPESGEESIPLFRGPDRAPQLSAEALDAHLAKGDRRLEQYQWELAPLDLSVGTEISFYAAAHDYQPAEGKSEPIHTITIVTKEELAQQLATRQRALLAELSRVVGRENNSHIDTRGLQIQLDELGQLDESELHELRGIEFTEREVRQALTGKNESVLQKADSLLGELKSNKIDRPRMADQLESLGQLLKHVEANHLDTVEQELTRARKFLQTNLSEDEQSDSATEDPTGNSTRMNSSRAEARAALNNAAEHQAQAIAALEQSLGNLRQWDQYRRIVRDLASLENQQQKIRDQTEETGNKTLGKDRADLEPQRRADLKKIAARQQELARNVDQTLKEMQQTEKELGQTDPVSAASIASSIKHAHDSGIGNQMRSASQNVENNQMGQALSRQQEAGKKIAEMIDILQKRGEPEIAKLVKKLREAEEKLAELARNHADFKKKLEQALDQNEANARKKQLDRLSQKREQLESQMQSLASQLKRLQAEQASESVADAAKNVEQSGQSAQNGNRQTAQQQSAEAQKQLEHARKQLAKTRQRAEAELLDEQMAQLPGRLRSLADRERAMQTQTLELDHQRNELQQLSRFEKGRAVELSQQQIQLVKDTSALGEELVAAEVFQRAFESVAVKMRQAAESLGSFRTGKTTQRTQQLAINKLELMHQALAKSKDEDAKGNKGGGDGGGQGGDNQQQNQQGPQRSVAEIKLLKLLQEDLNQRVLSNQAEMDKFESSDREVGPLLVERASLAEEQGELAQSTFNLLRSEELEPNEEGQQAPEENR